jgi:O-antigen ligase
MKKAKITRRGVVLTLSAICLLFLAVVVLKDFSQRFQNGMDSAGPDASRNERWDAGMHALTQPPSK